MKLLRNILLLVVVLVVGAVAASFFVLPSKASKEQTVNIDRPVSSVYALLASAPENHALADGVTQTVTAVEPLKSVTTSVSYDGGKSGTVIYKMAPGTAGSTVTIAVTQDLGINPLARLQGMSGEQLAPLVASAAAKLDEEGKKLPTADFSTLAYEVATLPAQPYLYLEGSTTKGPGQIKDGARQATAILRTVFASNNLTAGNPISVETGWTGDTYSFNFGMPYTGTRPALLIGVKAGETPAGTAIKVRYTGTEEEVIAQVYDKIDALIAAARLTEGANFEIYLDDPSQTGGSRNREIYYIVTGATDKLTAIAPPAAAPAAPVLAPSAAPAAPAADTSVTPAPATPPPAVPAQ